MSKNIPPEMCAPNNTFELHCLTHYVNYGKLAHVTRDGDQSPHLFKK